MDPTQPLAWAGHERFCQEYMIDQEGKASYIRAGYKSRGNAAEVKAHNLLKRPEVKARIVHLQKLKAESIGITVKQVVEEIRKVAFADAAKEDWLTPAAKNQALDMLMKHTGGYAQDNEQRRDTPQQVRTAHDAVETRFKKLETVYGANHVATSRN